MTKISLEKPLKYFPPKNGKYEVSAGLKPLDTASHDRSNFIFQIDEQYPHYWENTQQARHENLRKYYPEPVALPLLEQKEISDYVMARLNWEYPEKFLLEREAKKCVFSNLLTSERFVFSSETGELLESKTSALTPYADLWDALASQVPEDLSIWKMNQSEKKEWLASLHLTAPSHWAASEKIGRGFVEVHMPVAGIEPINERYWHFVQAICTKGPFERAVWSIATDNRLNHHPEPPQGCDPLEWKGRAFDLDNPQMYLRVERQTLSPFSKIEASFFTIRLYFYPVPSLTKEEIALLISAINSMTEASLVYKGLSESKPKVISYLESLL